MSVKTAKYVRKPFVIDAVRVTLENMPAVSEWCGATWTTKSIKGKLEPYIKVDVNRAMNDRQTEAYAGDWILKAGTGFKVYTNRAFHATFVKQDSVIDDMKAQDPLPFDPEVVEANRKAFRDEVENPELRIRASAGIANIHNQVPAEGKD